MIFDEKGLFFKGPVKSQSWCSVTRSYDSHDPQHYPATIIINIPLDPTVSGVLQLSHTKAKSQSWLDGVSPLLWLPTNVYASNIPLDDIGIRKGGMVDMPAFSASLALDTPYVYLPTEIFAILLQATHTSSEQDFVVDCGTLDIFPALVFGLRVVDAEEAEERKEIVVTPEQYVMKTKAEQCVLLVRNRKDRTHGGGDALLGWAAIRGRQFILDWKRHRMGFAQGFQD